MKANLIKQKNTEKGQVLLFVVLTMTVALALGVGVSIDTLKSIANVSDTDTSQRALAAAEGGVDRFLSLSSDELAQVSQSGGSDCAGIATPTASGCQINFDPTSQSPDNISTVALVNVEEFRYTLEDEKVYEFDININDSKRISLENLSERLQLGICWNGVADIQFQVLNDSGEVFESVVTCLNQPCNSTWEFEGEISAVSPSSLGLNLAYNNCTLLESEKFPQDAKDLRIRPLGGSAEFALVAIAGELPLQGYKITSLGFLLSDLNNPNRIQKIIRVYKSFPYSPGVLGFSIFSLGEVK